jgi:serine/threonine protein kinase
VALKAGARLGPYEILSAIGAGGMGEVYRAKDTRLERVVAIKILREHLADNPERRARFEREALASSKLNHPHICTLHDVGRDDGINCLVVEYLDGQTLADRLRKGALPIDQALAIAIDIADALDAAHRAGIIHRDLKPANVMLTKPGAKLLDFGIARLDYLMPTGTAAATTPATLTAENALLGTAYYMAPEQLAGGEADARSDVFAFGAVLYEMLTGRRAFDGETRLSVMTAVLEDQPPAVSTLQPQVPAVLAQLVVRCLAKDPEERWQTARDLRAALLWVRGTSDQHVKRRTPIEVLRRPA